MIVEAQHRSIDGPAAWYGSRMAESSDWVYRLSAADLREIDSAVTTVQRRGIALANVTPVDFPLPELGSVLTNLRDQVVTGRGFALIRGLPIDGVPMEHIALSYWGIGSYFGLPVSQNAKGHVLGHVKDIGHDPANPEHRIYATSARHRYHTDSCDVVGLLCVRPAKSGGRSSLVSSVTVHNEMLKTRPDLVSVLAQPFCYDRKGEIPAGKKAYYWMPIFNNYAGHLTTIYARDFIEAAQRFQEVPRLSEAQIEAMDHLDRMAANIDLRLDMDLRPGDIQLLHNHQILHARTAYEDYAEPERKRHLLRLWLAPPNGRPLPPVFEERYGQIEVGTRRGGITVPGAVLHAPLEAE